jgi:hypothetical protein
MLSAAFCFGAPHPPLARAPTVPLPPPGKAKVRQMLLKDACRFDGNEPHFSREIFIFA